jgi:hypothetical protein
MLIDVNKVKASLARESFFEFFKMMWPQVAAEELSLNWHIELLCDELQALAERVFRGMEKINDLVVNVSPGTSKSSIASVMFPPWTWTRDRTMRHLCGSYSYPLALDLSRKSRDVVTSDLYKELFPEVQLRADQNTKGYFQTTEGGYRYSFGVNGSVTGFHGHFITCLPWEALIATDRGLVPIGKIVDTGFQCHIMTLNHKTGETRWQPVPGGDGQPSRVRDREGVRPGRRTDCRRRGDLSWWRARKFRSGVGRARRLSSARPKGSGRASPGICTVRGVAAT